MWGFCTRPGTDATDLLAYQFALPGHSLSGEELELIVVQTETGQREQTSEGLNVQVVQRVVTETKQFDVLQTLEGKEVGWDISAWSLSFRGILLCCCVYVYLEGEVGNIDQLVVCEGEQVEESQLGESSRLNFFHTVVVDHKLL